MKKLCFIFLPLFIFMSCDDIEPGVHFHGCDEFLKNKDAWQETDSCEICYTYDTPGGPLDRLTTVREGDERKFISPIDYEGEPFYTEEELKKMDFLFYSMTDIYNHIQNKYEYLERNCEDDEQIDIYVKYAEIRGLKYPVYFHADITRETNKPGFGDFRLEINSYREEF